MAILINKLNREVKVIIPNMREFRVFYSDNEGSVMFFKRDWIEEKQEGRWKPSEEQIRETLIQLVQDAWNGRLTDEVSDERVYDACMTYLEKRKEQKYIGLSKADKLFLQDVADVLGDNEYQDAAKRLRDLSESLYLQPKAEWNEEEEKMLKWIEDILLIADGDLSDKLNGKVSPITDSAYSSMKLCIAKCLSWLKSLRPQKKEDLAKMLQDEYERGKEYGETLGRSKGFTHGYTEGFKAGKESVLVKHNDNQLVWCDGTHCINPHHDCVNCPVRYSSSGTITTPNSATIVDLPKEDEK